MHSRRASRGDPHHLASKSEVVGHLQRCFRVLAERTQLEPRFRHEYLGHEDSGSGERPVTVHCRRVDGGVDVTISIWLRRAVFGGTGPARPRSNLSSVLSIQPTSTAHFSSSQAAYLLTHLFLAGELATVPLYETDMVELRDASRDAFPAAAIALTLYNTSLIIDRLPRWVMNENGLDILLLDPL